MRDTLIDMDIVLFRLRVAVGKLATACTGARLVRIQAAPLSDLARREIATRQWIDDPTGYRAGVGPTEYRQRIGL